MAASRTELSEVKKQLKELLAQNERIKSDLQAKDEEE